MAKWNIDTYHGFAEFKVKHMGIAWVTGHIFGLAGEIDYDPSAPEDSRFEGSLDVKTLTTGVPQRDGHLMSDDFFNAEKYPQIAFHSHEVEMKGESKAKVSGHITIRDVTKEIELDVEFLGTTQKMMDEKLVDVAAFSLTTKLDRTDFGMNWNMDMPDGALLVGKEVEIRVDVEAIKA